MSIRILSPEVVAQIAAGEVLERPANLVKELVENALDAGATQIDVEFDRGGRDVTLRDNGLGIAPADLSLALKAHATSKINASGDIYRLQSFGFRGEALASISAVSELTVTSRPPTEAFARRLTSEFGILGEAVESAAPPGTEMRVRELFANVPARLSFMKSEASEHAQIKQTLKALALANENVTFRVRHKNSLLFHWAAEPDLARRAQAVLEGVTLYPGRANVDGLEAEVLVSAPHETQRLNRNLWFFVQGRWVQDRALGAAVLEGFRNLLMHGEFPTAIVRITCAPENVDVNVHPTKAQVKFRDPSRAFRAVCRAVRDALERAPWLDANDNSGREEALAPTFGTTDLAAFASTQTSSLSFESPDLARVQYQTKSFPLAQVRETVAGLSTPAIGTRDFAVADSRSEIAPVEPVSPSKSFNWGELQVIGQLNQTYIIAQNGEAMYLVDQHAAHERVVFERLLRDFQAGRIEVQNLLLPLTIDFPAEEVEAIHEHRAEIARLGLSVERMAPEILAVTAIPALVGERAIEGGLRKLGAELSQNGGSLAIERSVGDVFASLACHSVIRAGQSQSVPQMQSLLAQMDEFPLSSFCPHGRPVSIRRPFRDLEREFGRIV